MSRPSISVIVPVWNEIRSLPRTTRALARAVRRYEAGELFFVDNGSTDGSLEWLRENCTEATVLSEPELSVGDVRNAGARQASGDIYCFVDADCLVTKEHLFTIERAFSQSGSAVVGATYRLPEDASWIGTVWHELHRRGNPGPVNYINGCNLSIRASVFELIGGFSGSLESGEDAELCQRVRAAGGIVYEDPRIEVVHLDYPKSIGGFFRKQLWHGIGMFGTARGNIFDKPLLATITHLVLIGFSILYVGLGDVAVMQAISVLAVSLITVPTASVLHRYSCHGRFPAPLRAILLYEVYFAARAVAFVLAVVRMRKE